MGALLDLVHNNNSTAISEIRLQMIQDSSTYTLYTLPHPSSFSLEFLKFRNESYCALGLLNRILSQQFFNRPTLDVAQEILGKFLVCKKGNHIISAMITEVEAYVGPEDRASHASRGRTKRNEVMFGKAGYWYVYLIYGMHYCVNMVTEQKDYPAAILIRGVENVSGPGRVAKYFDIDKYFNAKRATRASGLWIEDRAVIIKPRQIGRGKRIGVDYAGKWKDKKWRFFIIVQV